MSQKHPSSSLRVIRKTKTIRPSFLRNYGRQALARSLATVLIFSLTLSSVSAQWDADKVTGSSLIAQDWNDLVKQVKSWVRADPTSASSNVTLGTSGSVGIGTAANETLLEKLNVGGKVKATGFVGDGTDLTGVVKTSLTDSDTTKNNKVPVWDATTGGKLLSSIISIVSGKVGIGTTTDPKTTLEVNGPVKIGGSDATCTTDLAGTLRTNNGGLEVCSGTSWVSQASGMVGAEIVAGTVQAFAMSTCPDGWIEANGAELLKATYPDLAAKLGTTYNITTTPSDKFKLPDYRGEFLRGWDNSRGVDAERTFGSGQGDELKTHSHIIPTTNGASGNSETPVWSNYGYDYFPAAPTSNTGGAETRPRNVAVLYCLKTKTVGTNADTQYTWIKSGNDVSKAEGNVGIGTTSPSAKLDVKASSSSVFNNSDGIKIEQNGSVSPAIFWNNSGTKRWMQYLTGTDLRIAEDIGGTPHDRITFQQDGKVGIGTTTPGGNLHIAKDNGSLILSRSNGMGGLKILEDLASGGYIKLQTIDDSLNWKTFLQTEEGISDASRKVIIAGDGGNVGIGTTTPGEKLQVNGVLRIDAANMPTWDTNARIWSQSGFGNRYDGFQHEFDVGVNRTAAMIIKNSGNVGIGTTEPGTKLHISQGNIFTEMFVGNTATSGQVLAIGWDPNSGSPYSFIRNHSQDNGGIYLKNGNVGIGTPAPSQKLDVYGSIALNGTTIHTSDFRLKKNINSLTLKAIEVLQKLRPVTFEWKEIKDDGMKGTQLGFIAQEVEKVLPELVSTQNNAEQTKSLNYDGLIPILTKAIQEQQVQIEELKAEIQELKKQ